MRAKDAGKPGQGRKSTARKTAGGKPPKTAKPVPLARIARRKVVRPPLSLRKPTIAAGETEVVTRTFTALVRDPEVRAAGKALALFYADVEHRLYARMARDLRRTGTLPGVDSLKAEFCRTCGLASRQYNAVAGHLSGLLKNVVANLEYRRGQVAERIVRTEKTIATLTADRDCLRRGDKPLRSRSRKPATLKKLKIQLAGKKQRLDLLKNELSGIERELQRDLPRVCFGGRKLARQRHLLKENKITAAEWKERWDQARLGQFQILGSHNETAGCLECQAKAEADGTFTLTLAVPTPLQQTLGKSLSIGKVDFNHGNGELAAALAHNAATKPLYGRMERIRGRINKEFVWKNPLKVPPRPAFGPDEFPSGIQATYRFTVEPRGLRIALTLTSRRSITSGDPRHGAIGVDTNAEFVSVMEVDGSGNPVRTPIGGLLPGGTAGDQPVRRRALGVDLAIPTFRRSRGRIEASIWAAVYALVDRAVETRKPIVVEGLDLERKKAALREMHGPKTARMR